MEAIYHHGNVNNNNNNNITTRIQYTRVTASS